MLKTIRKTIVGMMNQLRIARSLMPRRGDAGPLATGCAIRDQDVVGARRPKRQRGAMSIKALAKRPRPSSAAGLQTPWRLLVVALVLLEDGAPILRETVQRIVGRSLAADDERVPTLVGRGHQLGILGNRPAVHHHEHALVAGLVIGRRRA